MVRRRNDCLNEGTLVIDGLLFGRTPQIKEQVNWCCNSKISIGRVSEYKEMQGGD